jgi:uncharacterized protein involved in response to NO
MFKENTMTLLTIDEPDAPAARKPSMADAPLFRLGFRPFYLLAAAFAAISIPLWLIRYLGLTDHFAHVDLNWHMHEMIFGFVIAVVIGFLYTAGRNWTGLWTPTKLHLAALAALWLAGRVAMLVFNPALAAFVDILFLPFATWPMYRVLQRAGNKRNMFAIALLALLTLTNAAFHGAVLGWLPISSSRPVYAAIMIIVMLESVIAGRVIPGFTANGVKGAKPVSNLRQDRICMTLTGIAGFSFIFNLPAPIIAAFAFAAACAQLFRLAFWKSFVTLKNPLLWILHVSYAWISVGFFMLAFSSFNFLPLSATIHVLAIGATAGLIIGMITRTALGHTGRPLRADTAETAMYLLIQIGVIARLVAALQFGEVRTAALLLTATAWTLAFLTYLVVYAPYLLKARIDGKEG